ncbi:MAG: glycogen/starch/alpha-glucan phosphorylase [Acidilobaceae archaeon]|nr:glycogen/starch/alpha-glucan phosphorylase [Acidilobaceae archaeon]MCX8165850.1 glycogen/starch/alpha-glucan phosphorylase [Acidilobaceae archaeon]MDW7974858.1 glycogen/starch/alpha-glucan phosphorylase [Sulfolobales archaeon]
MIVSLAMEVALKGSANYAGGLGVLEADKFYAAGRLGLPYVLIAPFYPRGYVDYNLADGSRLVEVRHRHSIDFLASLRHVKSLTVKGRRGRLIAEADVYEYSHGTAKAYLYRITRPSHVVNLFKYLYRHRSDECTYYATAAAVSAEIVKHLERVEVVDVQEAHLALAPYLIKGRRRFVTHTPGPWGHPRLCKEEGEDLLDVSLPSVRTMTEAAMEEVEQVFAVSKLHAKLTRKMFPKYVHKISYVTNGVDLASWQRVQASSPEELAKVRAGLKEQLSSMISAVSTAPAKRVGGRLLVAWVRRMVRYKRPYFLERLVEERDLRDRFFLLVAGKPHAEDGYGREMAERLAAIAKQRENVYFHATYDRNIAFYFISGSDLLLFTPFPGWEASGTSQMKAMANGVPVLSSRDGASVEFIEDGVNGWLFGREVDEFLDIENDERAREIDEQEYAEMVRKLLEIADVFENDKERYFQISYRAYEASPRLSIERALSQYYPEYFAAR